MLAHGKDGKSARDHYEGAVERARKSYGEWSPEFADALRKLDEIRGPLWEESFDYLHRWFYELHGMREYDMNGARAFTPQFIEGWARLFDREPTADDVRALVAMDRAWRSSSGTVG